jgi:ABC-type multidrug transport system ATPase subunit
LKCITNELIYDDGIIKLFENNEEELEMPKRNIGYCPQENALFDYLTVEETLQFYKKLRGVNV